MDGLYDSDFYAWTQAQAAALRQAAADRVNLPLDWDHLAEEIDSMGRSERRELHHRLTVLLEHLLKLRGSPDDAPRRGWRATIRTQRRAICDALRDSPSLKRWSQDVLAECYRRAVEDAADDDNVGALPETCPFELETEILSESFFPEPPAG